MTGKRYYLTTLDAWHRHLPRCAESHFIILDGAAAGFRPAQPADHPSGLDGDSPLILVLVAADEAAHIALENDAEVEALPHPLARTPVSECAVAALAPLGIVSGDDTFTVAEKLARVNPLLRHRVF